jgi:8-oxo-dGTP pyrophosphatase MutT (NUDIX family)
MSEHDKKLRTEVSAGGIVFQRSEKGILIAFILDPFNKWTFAKGHVEPGEKSETAAIREVEEETGLHNLEAIEYLGKIDFWFEDKYQSIGAKVHKFVYYYLLEAESNAKHHLQREEKIKDLKWVPLEKAESFSSYKDTAPVLKKAVQILKKNFVK